MEDSSIFCNGEGQRFPVSQFRSAEGRLVIPQIHETAIPHFAVNGEPVLGEPVDPIPVR